MYRRIALGLWLVVSVCLIVELGLRGVATLWPSPLLVGVSTEVEGLVWRKLRPPGDLHLGFPVNQSGFLDDEVRNPRGPGPRIVSISDSFAWGAAPHYYHFTTVAERALPGSEFLNLGYSATGIDVYQYVLEAEALPFEPDLILVNLFIGNDLFHLLPSREKGVRGWLDPDQWLVLRVPQRLARVLRERFRRRSEVKSSVDLSGQYTLGRSRRVETAELAVVFPWLEDPTLEPPTLSQESFLEHEVSRAVKTRRRLHDDPNWRAEFYGRVEAMVESAGDIPILFAFIPDEYQVEDDLWAQVVSEAPRELHRFHPQLELRAYFDEKRIPYLDLLRPLREVPPLADGRRHVYFARDTHLNRRGNEIVGVLLAARIAELGLAE